MNVRPAVAVVALCLVAVGARAQELTPRAYWPAPKGTRVLSVGLSRVSGDIVPDPSLPITGVDSEIYTFSVGYLQTLDLFGRTANIAFTVPYSDGITEAARTNGEIVSTAYDGLGDVSAELSINFLGAPTMDAAGFAELRAKPTHILAGSVRLVVPTGNYDPDRIVNVGSNRWATKLELGWIAPLSTRWLFEASLGSWFFGNNDDFVGFEKEQDPILALQMHIVHQFRGGMWLSLDGNLYKGGRSRLDGEKLDDLQRDSKLGLTLVYPVIKGHLVKGSYSYGSVNDSDEKFDVFLLGYSYLF